jgi:hypothetical protein
MFEIEVTCFTCGHQWTTKEDDFGPAEPGDDHYEHNKAIEDEIAEHGHRRLCDGCAKAMEAAYLDESGAPRDRTGTLAEVLIRSAALWFGVTNEMLDPGIQEALEVFPNLVELGVLPIRNKHNRDLVALAEPLRRIGKPAVAITIGSPDDEIEHSFVYFSLDDAGEVSFSMSNHYAVVRDGAVNALDYAPDGTLLPRS